MKEGSSPRPAGPLRIVVFDGPESQWPVLARALGRHGFTLVRRADVPGLSDVLGLAGREDPPVFAALHVGTIGRGSARGDLSGVEPRPEELTAGTLAAGVAHEINNPLCSIVANLELALGVVERVSGALVAAADPRGPRAELAELRAELEDARAAAGHVQQIVKAVRDVCRPSEELPEIVDVRDAVELALRLAASELRPRARVVKECRDTPPVRSTALRLGRVFLNLLVNAAQALEGGDPSTHEIRVVTHTDARGWATVVISDSGVGIPAENLARVFDPFFTTKPSGVGSGLGLPICQRIVAELGGRIELDSKPGRGTTVTVSLPPAPARV